MKPAGLALDIMRVMGGRDQVFSNVTSAWASGRAEALTVAVRPMRGDRKDKFPPTLLSASSWTNKQIDSRQISKRKKIKA